MKQEKEGLTDKEKETQHELRELLNLIRSREYALYISLNHWAQQPALKYQSSFKWWLQAHDVDGCHNRRIDQIIGANLRCLLPEAQSLAFWLELNQLLGNSLQRLAAIPALNSLFISRFVEASKIAKVAVRDSSQTFRFLKDTETVLRFAWVKDTPEKQALPRNHS